MNDELKTSERDENLYKNKTLNNKVRQDKLYELFYDGVIDKEEFAKKKKELDNDLCKIKNEISLLKEKIEKEKDGLNSVKKIITRITDIINKKDYNSKVYERLVEEIIVFGSEIHIFFKNLNDPVVLRYTTEGRGSGYRVCCSIVEN